MKSRNLAARFSFYLLCAWLLERWLVREKKKETPAPPAPSTATSQPARPLRALLWAPHPWPRQ